MTSEHADRRVDLAQGDRLLDRVEQRLRGLGVVGDSWIGAAGPHQHRGRDGPGDHHGDDGHDQRTIAGDRPRPRPGILAGPEDERPAALRRASAASVSGPGLIGRGDRHRSRQADGDRDQRCEVQPRPAGELDRHRRQGGDEQGEGDDDAGDREGSATPW